jgi:hypothetical protein
MAYSLLFYIETVCIENNIEIPIFMHHRERYAPSERTTPRFGAGNAFDSIGFSVADSLSGVHPELEMTIKCSGNAQEMSLIRCTKGSQWL